MFSRRATHRSLLLPAILGSVGVFLLMGWVWSAPAALQTPGVGIGPNHFRQADAGQVVTFHHILTNTGTTSDTFWLQALSMQGWPVELLGGDYPTGTAGVLVLSQVGAHISAPFQVSLTVPSNAAGVTEITIITATSQLSPTVYGTVQDTTIVPCRVYLPLVFRPWTPAPHRPTLNPISNADSDDFYSVSWIEQPFRKADTYTLEEATDAAFTAGLREVCTTDEESCRVGCKQARTYYYRVRGCNAWGYSPWSNVQTTTVVIVRTPVLYRAICWVSDPTPRRDTTVTVYSKLTYNGNGMVGVSMEAEWDYGVVKRYCYGTSGSDGIASCSRDISEAIAGDTVDIYVTMTSGGPCNIYYRCTTSFTPHD